MKLRPMHGRLVVKLIDIEEKTAGGIILPSDNKKQPTTGIIEAISTSDIPTHMTTGDTILFGKFAGTPVKVDNKKFTIMNIDEVLAVIE